MIGIVLKHVKRIAHPLAGLLYALRNDIGFAIDVYGGALVIAIVVYFFSPLSELEIFFIALAYILILVTEMQNSSIEHALDKIHPERHEDIKHSKDMASASVLLAGFFALFVIAMIALP